MILSFWLASTQRAEAFDVVQASLNQAPASAIRHGLCSRFCFKVIFFTKLVRKHWDKCYTLDICKKKKCKLKVTFEMYLPRISLQISGSIPHWSTLWLNLSTQVLYKFLSNFLIFIELKKNYGPKSDYFHKILPGRAERRDFQQLTCYSYWFDG